MLQLDINGRDAGKNSHLSLYMVILCGECDSTLSWPLKINVKFTLYNFANGENVTAKCAPVLARPTLDGEDVKVGFSQFIGHQFVDAGFVLDNMILLNVKHASHVTDVVLLEMSVVSGWCGYLIISWP